MAKKYTRKQVSSLTALDLEQERIQYKLRKLEDDTLELFSPQQLAITLIGKFLSRKRASFPTQQHFAQAGKLKNQVKNKPGSLKAAAIGMVSNPLFKKVAKKAGISFLQWQAFNLALFAGKKIWQKYRKNTALKS